MGELKSAPDSKLARRSWCPVNSWSIPKRIFGPPDRAWVADRRPRRAQTQTCKGKPSKECRVRMTFPRGRQSDRKTDPLVDREPISRVARDRDSCRLGSLG